MQYSVVFLLFFVSILVSAPNRLYAQTEDICKSKETTSIIENGILERLLSREKLLKDTLPLYDNNEIGSSVIDARAVNIAKSRFFL